MPEAFQQKLSAEKTPTLCNTFLAFDVMVSVWKELQESMGEPYIDIIQAGINKLDAYHNWAEVIPAYAISMCEFLSYYASNDTLSSHTNFESFESINET